MLKETFIKLLTKYTDNFNLIIELWSEIESLYSGKKRYYHTLLHIENLLNQLIEIKNEINSRETILFAVYYHDIVYNPLKTDNEERSAEFAETRMKRIFIPHQIIESCKAQILATKKHIINKDIDTNYLIDADLSILGQNWNIYSNYSQNVRKEYMEYSDIIYYSGRKKVLNHFLEMERIFKTNYFYYKFEQQARKNLQKEIEVIQNG